MNFNLTITDMTEDEFARLFANINVPCVAESSVVAKESIEQPVEDPITADVDGLPWDARIHSSNHKINSDGRWQRRRGVSDEEFNAVKNELLGIPVPVPLEVTIAPINTPNIVPNEMELVVDNQFAPQIVTPAPVVAPEPIPAPAVEPVSAPVTAPVVDSAVLYQTMFDKFKVGMNNGKIGKNDIQDLLAKVNNTFKTQYTSIAFVKDDISAMQFIINELVARGL